jgi:pimeloyl-ACP methyl ester carboxylesterase
MTFEEFAEAHLAAAVALDLDVWASTHRGAARAALTQLGMQAQRVNEDREGQSEWRKQLPPISDSELAAIAVPSLIVVGDSDMRISSRATAGVRVRGANSPDQASRRRARAFGARSR